MTSSWVPCPMCFHPAEPDARFCSRCGASMDGAASMMVPGAAVAPSPSQATAVVPPDATVVAAPGATVAFERPAVATPMRTTTTASGELVGYHVAGRYRIERELGRGAFGVVMRGWDQRENRPVAVKMLPGLGQVEPEERKGVLATFRREAQALAWLKHPAIVALIDVVEDADVPCLVMELVEGETLAAKIAREKALPIQESLRILRELVQALHHAHSAGVVHRDLKPANILLGAGGVVKVTDFGLAKVTTSVAATMGTKGGLLGTPHYMSPEQASGRAIDARSDLFAVGAIAWEMLTGRKAFDGPLSTAIYRIIYEGVEKPSTIRPDLPPVLDAVVMKALEKNVDVRFQNALEMGDALGAAAATLTVATPTAEMTVVDLARPQAAVTGEMPIPPGAFARAAKAYTGDVERMVLVVGMAIAVLIGVVAVVMLSQRRDDPVAAVNPVSLPPGLHLSGEGVAYLDGARVGLLPLDLPLPAVGKHLVTVVVPRQGVMRRTIDVPPEPAFLEVKVADLSKPPATIPEELEVLGVLEGAAAPVLPLALVRDSSGTKGWIHAGERFDDAVVALIDAQGVAFDLPLSPPESGTWQLRRPVVPVSEPLSGVINLGSEPSGMVVSQGGTSAAVGYTPCRLNLPGTERMSLVLKDTERKKELVLRDLDVRRLAFMGEMMVVMPQ